MKIVAAKKLLKANDQLAEENRARFNAAGVFVVNIVGSPGCGKTTLLEDLLGKLKTRLAPAVIEGDLASSIDAERIDKLGVPVVQINTDGACHLDATMVAAAADGFDLAKIDLLVIENVGNLVCTAGFDLGEHLRVVILSVSEGDDKIAKYPTIFQKSDALLITKTDLLKYSNFSVERAGRRHEASRAQRQNLRGLGPGRLRHGRAGRLARRNARGKEVGGRGDARWASVPRCNEPRQGALWTCQRQAAGMNLYESPHSKTRLGAGFFFGRGSPTMRPGVSGRLPLFPVSCS